MFCNGQGEEMVVSGVCKDCGNGTLNNDRHEAFGVENEVVFCLACNSTHVDIVVL